MSTKIKFIPALTGYRAIAAWMLFIFHFYPYNKIGITEVFKPIVYKFHFGVEMFLVLSGFLITYRYFYKKDINYKEYIVNRFARIYPIYIILTICVFLVGYIKTNEWTQFNTVEFIASITVTKGLFKDLFFSGIPQGWTLTVEELFYFFAPLYFIFIRKSKYNILLIPIVVFVLGTVINNIFDTFSNLYGFLQTRIHFMIFEFFSGVFLAYYISNIKKKISFKYCTYLGLFIVLLYLCVDESLINSISPEFVIILVSLFGIVPFMYGLIFENTFIRTILSSKYMVLFGKSSYVFYLIHKGWIPMAISDYITSNVLLIFILLNIISILLFKYLEDPLNNFIREVYRKRKAQNN